MLLDTQGPEIRTGSLLGDANAKVELREGDEVVLTTEERHRECGTAAKVFVNYPQMAETLHVGSSVLLDDGAVALRVTATDTVAGEVRCGWCRPTVAVACGGCGWS